MNVINDEMTQLRNFSAKQFVFCSLGLLTAAFFVIGCASILEQKQSNPVSDKCREVRGAMDVGSGSTKIKIAVVDTCEVKVIKVLAEDQVAIAFKENIDIQGNLSTAFIKEASEKIHALSDHAVRNGLSLSQLAVVATQAARESRNIGELKSNLANKGIAFTVISQQEESTLGHLAAAVVSRLKPSDFTSFDIGGGSFQLVNESGQVKMLGGQLASVSFKNYVLTAIQSRTAAQSPNPILPNDANAAIKYAAEYARRLADASKGFVIKNTVVGIGGVFGNSIRNQLRLGQTDHLKVSNLENEIPKLIRRTPKDLVGPYADTESTNLLLVLGLMKGFGIKKVLVFKANLTDGVLFTPQFYRRLAN